jgi:acyl carrier protein
VHLPQLPLNVNGKVDRKALPEPVINNAQPIPDEVAGITAKRLRSIVAAVLGIAEQAIGLHDDFFRLGGHSIKAIQLINEIYLAFSVKISLRKIFEHTSIERLSHLVESMSVDTVSALPRVEEKEYYPTSAAQARLYAEYLQNKNNLAYNICGAFAVTGELDVAQLQQTFQLLVNRHESLRTGFKLTEEGVLQKIYENVTMPVTLFDDGRGITLQRAAEEFVQPFDLSHPPLIRIGVLKRNKQESYLLIDVHHIVCDGISLNILVAEFNRLYHGVSLGTPAARYIDYVEWQRHLHKQLDKQRLYWANKLAGETPELYLPAINDSAAASGNSAAVKELCIGEPLYTAIKSFVAAHGVSDFMCLLSIYYILLSKVSGSTDIIVGTDAVGRTHPGLMDTVGTFINLLPLRIQLTHGSSFVELAAQVKECVLEAFDNQDVQVDEIVSLVQASGASLIKVHFSFANFIDNKLDVQELQFVPVDLTDHKTTQYEFKLEVAETNRQYLAQFIYNKGMYDEETMETLVTYYYNILSAVMQQPSMLIGDIEMASPAGYSLQH